MNAQSTRSPFEASDVELLEKALGLIPELEIAAYATKLARQRIKYPILDHSGLLALFDRESRSAAFKQHKITFEQAIQFFPQPFFPIESEDDFLRKVFMALEIGRRSHLQSKHSASMLRAYAEMQLAFAGAPAGTVMLRPSPSATHFK